MQHFNSSSVQIGVLQLEKESCCVGHIYITNTLLGIGIGISCNHISMNIYIYIIWYLVEYIILYYYFITSYANMIMNANLGEPI